MAKYLTFVFHGCIFTSSNKHKQTRNELNLTTMDVNMEIKFTTGQWEAGKNGFSVECDNDIIATCHYVTERWITEEQAKANAQLISAAPDMFYVLIDLYNDREVWSDLFEDQKESICRVLNKATGSTYFQ
jgi:hypothetical protein